MNRSRRCRASSIKDPAARSGVSFRPSSRTAWTMSATRSGATFPSSSADRVAIMPADSCRLSFVMGPRACTGRCESPEDGATPYPRWLQGSLDRWGRAFRTWCEGVAVLVRWLASAVSYTHLRAHETVLDLVCRLLLEKKQKPRAPTRSHMLDSA